MRIHLYLWYLKWYFCNKLVDTTAGGCFTSQVVSTLTLTWHTIDIDININLVFTKRCLYEKKTLKNSTSDHDYFKCIWQNLFRNTWFLKALYVRTWERCLERFDTRIPNESYARKHVYRSIPLVSLMSVYNHLVETTEVYLSKVSQAQ